MNIHRIAVLGVGLLGGSLGLAWKSRRPDLTIVGFDRGDVGAQARTMGAVDEMADDPAEAVRNADLVVLAAPISGILWLMDEIAPHLRPGALVTDVGSVKRPVLDHARATFGPETPFIGGHPMAGSEGRGVAHADPLLFENATYVLSPPDARSGAELRRDHPAFVSLLEATGARILVLDADRHDRIAAAVSHLPQLLAVALTNQVAELNAGDSAFLNLAAGGFRDMTRIASSPFGMWRDILVANQGNILDTLARFAATFQKLRNRVLEEDLEALEEAFDAAATLRDTIPRNTKGFLNPLAEVFVFAEDRPGTLLSITQTLYDAGLNIKDIELLKIREGTGGTFRLGFADGPTADAAVAALHAAGHRTHRL